MQRKEEAGGWKENDVPLVKNELKRREQEA